MNCQRWRMLWMCLTRFNISGTPALSPPRYFLSAFLEHPELTGHSGILNCVRSNLTPKHSIITWCSLSLATTPLSRQYGQWEYSYLIGFGLLLPNPASPTLTLLKVRNSALLSFTCSWSLKHIRGCGIHAKEDNSLFCEKTLLIATSFKLLFSNLLGPTNRWSPHRFFQDFYLPSPWI